MCVLMVRTLFVNLKTILKRNFIEISKMIINKAKLCGYVRVYSCVLIVSALWQRKLVQKIVKFDIICELGIYTVFDITFLTTFVRLSMYTLNSTDENGHNMKSLSYTLIKYHTNNKSYGNGAGQFFITAYNPFLVFLIRW